MTNQQEKNNTKTVSFKGTVTVRDIIHIADFTEAEVDACFYCISDYREFKLDARRAARMIAMKQKIDERKFCVRGVEHLATRDAYQIRSDRRRTSVVAVLEEQMEQFLDCECDDEELAFYDDEKIAAVYADAVRDSVTSAYIVGLSDEMVVREHKNTERDDRRPSHNAIIVSSPGMDQKSNCYEARSFRVRRQMFNAAA